MRRFAVGLCIFLSTLFVFVSTTTHWARDLVLDENTFVTTVDAVAQDPEVQAELTKKITDAIFAQPEVQQFLKSDLAELIPKPLRTFEGQIRSAARSGVSSGVAYLLRNETVQDVYDTVLRSVHRQLMNLPSGQPLQLTSGDLKKLVGANDTSGIVRSVVDLIPNNVVLATILTGTQVRLINTAKGFVGNFWFWSAIFAVLFAFAAVALSAKTVTTVRTNGLTNAIVAVVVLLVVGALPSAAIAGAPDETSAAFASAFLNAILPSLRGAFVWVLVLSIIVFVVALLWGRTGLVKATKRAFSSTGDRLSEARAELAARRAAKAAGTGLAVPGQEGAVDGAAAGAEDEGFWQNLKLRVEVFWDSLEADKHLAHAGSRVEANLASWRYGGVIVGAVLLLLWPRKTFTTLLVIAALVVIYLAVLELLVGFARKRAEQGDRTVIAEGTEVIHPPAAASSEPAVTAVKQPAAVGAAAPGELAAGTPALDSGGDGGTGAATAGDDTVRDLSSDERARLAEQLERAHDSGFLSDEAYDRQKKRLGLDG